MSEDGQEKSRQLLPREEEEIERVLNRRISNVSWVDEGYSPAKRFLLSFSSGETAFAKIATSKFTVDELKREIDCYRFFGNKYDFVPKLFGYGNLEKPFIVTEDLSTATWSNSWTEDRLDLVLDTLEKVWEIKPSEDYFRKDYQNINNGWKKIKRDPSSFLSLKLVSEQWFDEIVSRLVKLDAKEIAMGENLMHRDLRSDNLCILNGQVKFVDWGAASIGSPRVDLAFWLPSLRSEGGPKPQEILPDSPKLAILVSGYFAANAGLPDIPNAPWVREIQRKQLKFSLSWLVEELDLPPLDY